MAGLDLGRSRLIWRALALDLDRERRAVCDPKQPTVLVEDDVGDLLLVQYGVHGYPVGIGRLDRKCWEKLRPMARRVAGDVRTARKPLG